MGPNLIIDKSGIEQLSVRELDLLDCYFHIIIPPVFVLEVLGNLAQRPDERPKRQKGTPEDRVSAFARKVGLNSSLTMDYKDVCFLSLLGYEFETRRGCIPYQSRKVETKAGHRGIIIEDSEIDEAISRWERREFTVDDRTAAEFQKASRKQLEMDEYKELFRWHDFELGRLSNFDEVGAVVSSIMRHGQIQYGLLYRLFKEIGAPNRAWGEIVERWNLLHQSHRYLKTFSCYAAFCIQANLFLVIAQLAGLVNHEETSGSDIKYCYYLPRCDVFVSEDKLHKRIHHLLLDSDQTFVSAHDLKVDLKKRVEAGLSVEHENRTGPSEFEDSVVNQLWEKYSIKPRQPVNLSLETHLESLSPDGQIITETFEQFLRKRAREIDEGSNFMQVEESDSVFVKRSRTVTTTEIERKFGKEVAQKVRDSMNRRENND